MGGSRFNSQWGQKFTYKKKVILVIVLKGSRRTKAQSSLGA